MPELFVVGPVAIQAFGFALSAAVVVGGLVLRRNLRTVGYGTELALTLVFRGTLGGLIGARAHFIAQHLDASDGFSVLSLMSTAGFSWFGGLLGALIATGTTLRSCGVPWAVALDAAAPALAIGLAILRVGCHLAGDGDWGTPTHLPWGVAYTSGTAFWPHLDGVRVHPIALYESAAMAALFVLLQRRQGDGRPAGAVGAMYLLFAGGERFFLEMLRTNHAVGFGMSEAQWISLVLMTIAVSMSWLLGRPAAAARPRLACVLMLPFAVHASGAAAEVHVQNDGALVDVRFSGSRGAALHELARAAGAEVSGTLENTDVVQLELTGTWDDAIRRVAGGQSFAITYGADGRPRGIRLLGPEESNASVPATIAPAGLASADAGGLGRLLFGDAIRVAVGPRLTRLLGTDRPLFIDLLKQLGSIPDRRARVEGLEAVAQYADDHPIITALGMPLVRAVGDEQIASGMRMMLGPKAKRIVHRVSRQVRSESLRTMGEAVVAHIPDAARTVGTR